MEVIYRFYLKESQGNKCVSMPETYYMHLKESHKNLEMLLAAIKYSEHEWVVSEDLQIRRILLGKQPGFLKFLCFLRLLVGCVHESHWDKRECPART